MLVLGMVWVTLIVVVGTLLINILVVWVRLMLNAAPEISRLFGYWAGGRARPRWLKHSGVFDERLWHVSRIVGRAIVLILRISVWVVVGNGRRIRLLRSLRCVRLRLIGGLRGVGLGGLSRRRRKRRRWLLANTTETFDIIVTKLVARGE